MNLSRQQRKRIDSFSRRYGPERATVEILRICLADYRSQHPDDQRGDVEILQFRLSLPKEAPHAAD